VNQPLTPFPAYRAAVTPKSVLASGVTSRAMERPIQEDIEPHPRQGQKCRTNTGWESKYGGEHLPQHCLGILKQSTRALIRRPPKRKLRLNRLVEKKTYHQVAQLVETRKQIWRHEPL
jgi:hypothetical protein